MFIKDLLETHKKWTAIDVVRDILGTNNVMDGEKENPEKLAPTQFLVVRPWTPWGAMFDTFDQETGGCIALFNPYGSTPKDIAHAAHESYHAWLHQQSKNFRDEQLVNELATKWLHKHLSGMFLRASLDEILKSKINYKHN
ncbi:MAG: hypothetical protein ACXW0J_07515 [Nitrososphaeraceae archaeon]